MSAYRICGDSQKGRSHESSGTVCQDSYHFMEKNDFVVAAVADGLGSSKHSDIASRIAAFGAVEHCSESIRKGMSDNDILQQIRNAFDDVNFKIKMKADDALDDYDTTLTLAVFIDGEVYFGHAGDSGIIALRHDGVFEEVTKPQLGSGFGKERPVHPLASQSRWVFDKYSHQAQTIFLMTDGMLNKVIPPILEEQDYKLCHAYLYYLFDNMRKNPDISNWVKSELEQTKPSEINYDDKTLVAVMCEAVGLTLQPQSYYEFPSEELWEQIIKQQQDALYPYKKDSRPPTVENEQNLLGDVPPEQDEDKNIRVNRQRRTPVPKRKGAGVFRKLALVFLLGLALGIVLTNAFFLVVNDSGNYLWDGGAYEGHRPSVSDTGNDTQGEDADDIHHPTVSDIGNDAWDGETEESQNPTENVNAEAFTVIFVTNNGNTLRYEIINSGSVVKKLPDLTSLGYKFAGWYTDEELTMPFFFNTSITEELSLYAKWNAVADRILTPPRRGDMTE